VNLLANKFGVNWEPCGTAMCLNIGGITISSYIDRSFNGPALLINAPDGLKFKIRLR
jgi:hypothetical protein